MRIAGVLGRKSLRRWVRVTLTALLTAMLAACSTVPETGRSQVMLVDAGQAAQLGSQQFDQLKKKEPISHDPKLNEMVTEVGRKIAKVVDIPNAKWEFVVFDKPDTVNAFALPGGKVGVYSGLFKVVQNKAQLAAVLGHEIGHVVARHGSERMSQGMLVQLGGVALQAALDSKSGTTQQLAMAAYGVGSQVGVLLPFSRKQELEADHLGMLYMARAGYDPHQAIELWKNFSQYTAQHGGSPPEWLSTHPVDSHRIEELKKYLPEAMKDYRQASA